MLHKNPVMSPSSNRNDSPSTPVENAFRRHLECGKNQIAFHACFLYRMREGLWVGRILRKIRLLWGGEKRSEALVT
jgi:hypothetical protein